MASWSRPPGPPNIWDVVEGFDPLNDNKKIKISIQEVPDELEKHQEVKDLLLKYFLPDEPISKSIGRINGYIIIKF